MNDFDIPIFKSAYDLYAEFYQVLKNFPRQDRYTLGQQCEHGMLELLELFASAGQIPKQEKLPVLSRASVKLGMVRVHLRLAKEIHALDQKRYVILQERVDEIGRMLGGWMRALKNV